MPQQQGINHLRKESKMPATAHKKEKEKKEETK